MNAKERAENLMLLKDGYKKGMTTVEWFIEQLEQKGDASVNVSIGRMQISIKEADYINIINQAKKMEKKQKKYSKDDMLFFANLFSPIEVTKEHLKQLKKK